MIRVELNPKQKIFWQRLFDKKTRIIGFGGAKKGGKSFAARIGVIARALQYPGTNHALIRQTVEDVKKNHLEEIKRFCRKHKIKAIWKQAERCFEFVEYTHEGTPSKVYLQYAEDINDANHFQGIEWLTLMYDEATQFAEDVVVMINNELIVPTHCPDAMGKIIYTCNPIGIGKRWMYQNVVLAGERGDEGIVWITAKYTDNKHFTRTNPHFEENLRRQNIKSPWIASALIEGRWDADPDKFYPFDPREGSVHVKKLTVPYYAKWYCGVDYGYSKSAFIAVYIAHWKDRHKTLNRLTGELEYREHWHVVDEVVLYYTDLDIQAATCLEKERELQKTANMPPVIERFADPATDVDKPSEQSEISRSIRDAWDKYGFITTPAQRRTKFAGLQAMRERLHKEEMSFDPRCKRCIQEFTDAIHQKDANGMLGSLTDPKQPDDAQDACRYPTAEVFLDDIAEPRGSVYDDLYLFAA